MRIGTSRPPTAPAAPTVFAKTRAQLQVLLTGMALHASGADVLLVLPVLTHGLIANERFHETRFGRLAEIENGAMAVTTIALTFAVVSDERFSAFMVGCLILLVLACLLLLPPVAATGRPLSRGSDFIQAPRPIVSLRPRDAG